MTTVRTPQWPKQKPRGLMILVLLVVVLIFSGKMVGFITDWLWYQEVGYVTIFNVMFTTQMETAALFGIIFFVILFGNLFLAARISATGPHLGVPENVVNIPFEKPGDALFKRIILIVSAVLAFLAAIQGATQWESLLRFVNATPFGIKDPLFDRDVGFYVFELPFLQYLQGWGISVVLFTIVTTGAVYAIRRAVLFMPPRFFRISPAARAHVMVLVGVLFLLTAWGFWLDLYELLYVKRGVVFGAGYTDATTQLWVLKILAGLSVLIAAVFVAVAYRWNWRLPVLSLMIFALLVILGRSALPVFVQKFKVVPNEVVLEKPYLEKNIRYTRIAYGLQDIEDRVFPAEENLTLKDIRQNDPTIKNIRLWDYAPLLQTYSQLQEIRTYYKFLSVNNDRYTINGESRQTMISPRELSYAALPSRTWVNEHMTYTHGYGAVMGPVNRISREGLPEFFIKDIPPVSSGSIKITRPEIYYGNTNNDYVFVRAKRPEFDYPVGDKNVYSRYEGTGGVPLSFWKKVLFAVRFHSLTILLSDDITSDSRIMFYRTVRERITRVIPFARMDAEPYLVVSPQGRLLWFADAYTTTDRFPYSEPVPKMGNYIRNTLKIIVDAYDGSVQVYVSDDKDPILKTYARIFPGVFKPLKEMNEALRSHIRYPPGMLRIQAHMYQTYHMQDAQVFYNKEDLWTIPRSTARGAEQEMTPYYTIMKLPGEKNEEFILLLPFTPAKKDNMSAWMAARCDMPNYGKIIVYNFPKQKLVYGPRQIEARINQDPVISQQLSLWNQRGSQVIAGSLLAIPIETSIIYVQPIYLAAEKGQLPELRRVVVAFGNAIVMEETLEQALRRVFGADAVREAVADTVAAPREAPAGRAGSQQISEALAHYRKAQEYLRAGNWSGYGDELRKMEAILTAAEKQSRTGK
jgi:uncharacterized membrane protein (UPF0182 family)